MGKGPPKGAMVMEMLALPDLLCAALGSMCCALATGANPCPLRLICQGGFLMVGHSLLNTSAHTERKPQRI